MNSPIGKKVLIAMTGRRDSTVAAYLLKKQGYSCIGITFLFSDEKRLQQQIDHIHKKVNKNEEDDSTAEETSANKHIPKEKLYSRCHVKNIDKVSDVCKKLDILFYGVKASDQFSAEVTDQLVGNKLAGKTLQSCVHCNNVKFSLLIEKAEELGCDYIATGHYAKVVENQKTGYFYIHTANDLEHDQSYLLSKVSQKSLKKLILPLSETRLEEVEKVMKMIDFELPYKSTEDKNCYVGDTRLPSLVEVCSSPKLLRTGHLFLEHENIVGSEHKGLHHFEVGQKNFKTAPDSKTETNLMVSKLITATGAVVISPIKDLYFDRLLVNNILMDPQSDKSKPLQGFVKMSVKKQMEPCHVYFKNFNTLLIIFEETFGGVIAAGTSLAIYNKPGISGKVILSGEVQQCGIIYKGELTNYIKRTVDEDDEDDEKEKDKSYIPLPEFFH